MAEKRLNARIVHKHETEANWLLATNFIPMQGEIIIYDIDSTHSYERVKVGDGKTLVSALPFVDANKVDKVSGKGLSTNDYTTTEKNKLAGIAEGANKTVVDTALSSTSTNPVQNKVIYSKLDTLIGGTPVSEQISTAIANKSDVGHSHDDKYYTESEIDSKLSGKSDSGHTHSTYVNQNAFSNVVVGSTTIAADSTTDTLTLVAGSNVTLTPDASGDKITIAATNTVYTHPNSGVTAGTYKSVTVNAQGHVTAGTNPTTLSGYGITDAATKTELSAISALVGDEKVSEQISTAIANKSDVGHTHDEDYDVKGAADTALVSAKTYADSAATKVKNDLLNGAGTAYDTLKELGDLIDDNVDAIEALEAVAANKANTSDLTAHTGNKSNPHGVTASQISAVPTSRTVNGKALSSNIQLSASDVGADASGAANTALTNAKAYTDAEIVEWVGDTKVSEQISTAIASKSDTDHTHNYAGSSSAGGAANSVKTKLTVKLNGGSTEGTNLFTYNGSTAKTINITPSSIGAAASSHGNHVPTIETADNAKFLRNDNTWQTVTPANIGAAASNHGTHVSYSTTAPVMDGTASAGSASTVARSDHKHPTDTSRASASDVTKLQGLVGDEKVSDQINTALNNATADDFGIYVQETEPTNAVAGDIWIDTANDPSYIPPTIPEVTQNDNGKVLMVVNGKLQLVNLNLSVDANGVVSM